MTEKRPTSPPSPGKGRRKHAAPTIDLTATEVPAPENPAAEATAHEMPAQDVPPVTSEADPPPHAAAPESEPDTVLGPSAEPKENSPARPVWPVLAAGIAGAMATGAILLALWLTGVLPGGDSGADALRARIAGLETQVQDLQKRPAPATAPAPAPDSKAIEVLTQRAGKLEEQLAAALTALNRRSDDIAAASTQARERAVAAEKAVADLRGSVQDVSKTANAGASSADLAPLQQRIAALEESAKAVNAEIAKVTNLANAPDTAARAALSAAALRDAVASGRPFAAELAQAKALGADAKTTAVLEPFAASGLPSEKSLASDLSALLPGMIKTAGSPPVSGGFLERLQANAGQLVRVRPVDAPVGDDPSAVLARLEADAAKADIAAALDDLGKLSDAHRAPAQGWIAKAQSRQAALAAARQYAADAARSLGSK